MECVIYIRWSSTEQALGNSPKRQIEMCRDFASSKGWVVLDTLIDDGKSAFRGAHLETGKLGEFQEDVESRTYPNGIVMVVEKIDRLSRQVPAETFKWFYDMIKNGVTFAAADTGRIYNSTTMDMAGIVDVVVQAALANQESANKSARVGKAWAEKRARLANGSREIMTTRVPGWLSVDRKAEKFVIHPDRAATVKRIFELTASGQGKNSIARTFNEERVPTFGKSTAWHASYIQKVLANPAVIGEFQPGTKPSGSQRRLVDLPIADYYPAIIDANLYARAKVAMASRTRASMGRGRAIANLFSGMGRCSVCNGKITLRSKGQKILSDGRLVREDYLVCDNRQRGILDSNGRVCRNNVKFKYSHVEKSVLDAVLAQAMDDTHFADRDLTNKVAVELTAAELELTRIERRSDSLLAIIGVDEDDDKAIQAYKLNRENYNKQKEIVSNLKAKLLSARGKVSPEEHTMRIRKLRSDMQSQDESVRLRARSSVRLALGELIEEMTFHRKGPRVGLRLISGSRILVINTDHPGIALDIKPSSVDNKNNKLTARQLRVQERILQDNALSLKGGAD